MAKSRVPVVALESTIVSHGMPFPSNLETAMSVERIVREGGCEPATIAIRDGFVNIGLEDEGLLDLAKSGAEGRAVKCRYLHSLSPSTVLIPSHPATVPPSRPRHNEGTWQRPTRN